MEEHSPSTSEADTGTTRTQPSSTAPAATVGRRFDPVTFVGGLIFVVVAVIGLTDRVQLSVADVQWLGPLLLVGVGILLVASAAGPRDHRTGATPEAD